MLFRLEHPEALWAFLPLLVLLVIMRAGHRKKEFSWRRWFFTLTAFSACVLGLARPQGGGYSTSSRGSRGDLYLALDVSHSMIAEDLSPSRLGFSTAFVLQLLRELPGIRVAVFPFAADGYLQMPLSIDADAVTDLLSALDPSLTTSQGTNFAISLDTLLTAITKATQAPGYEPAPTRVLLLSDGESHVGLDRSVLDRFRRMSIPIDTVGVATAQGALIALDADMVTMQNSATVRTVLNEKMLREISERTGGNYHAPRFDEIPRVASQVLRGMELGKLKVAFKVETEFYPALFLMALILFSIELLYGRWQYLIRAGVTALLFLATTAQALDPDIEKNLGTSPELRPYRAYNEGIRLAKEGKTAEAAELFRESALETRNPELKKQALYNLGNAFLKMQDPVQALNSYQRAYDTKAPTRTMEEKLNRDISENILLARQIEKQQAQQQQEGGEGEGDSDGQPKDPGKPKQFQPDKFDEKQKKRMFDLVSSEEQQVLQRLMGKDQKAVDPKGRPW